MAAGAVVLRAFPPEHYGFYPVCPFHAATGLLCCGCGGTRALAALAHGDAPGALHWNALVTLLLPCLAVYLGLAYARAIGGQAGPVFVGVPRSARVGLTVVAVAFMVWRNLP